jgi:hypothetical protein
MSAKYNPYKEEFDELQDTHEFKGQQWFGKRQHLVDEYSWAVPNDDVLAYLNNFDYITEVGAGSGYWAKCIEEHNVYTHQNCTVTATDSNPPDDTYTTVYEESAQEVTDDVVLLVWPPVNSMMAASALSHEPNHVLYVGEGRGGCTANDLFFNLIEDEYGLVETIDTPSYAGVHDNFYHYVRKV